MAKKNSVICAYCGERFDKELEPFVKINGVRYAHESCNTKADSRLIKDSQQYKELETYIKNIYNIEKISIRNIRHLKKFHDEYEYSYSGIQKTLEYMYLVKKIKKISEDEISLVPYYYNETRKHYQEIWIAINKNNDKDIKKYVNTNIIDISISPPKREPIKKNKFSFLDKDDITNEE